ncbi:MAG: hypothetical protein ACE5GJ_02370 [Gemmatimonadota bacterium]
MSRKVLTLSWLPPFVVGVAVATAAEIALGLLLYTGPGLMRSLTVVLVVEAVSLGLGLAMAPRLEPGLLDLLRRRWLACLGVFLLATLFSAVWSLLESLGGDALTQGMGLAFLAGLPLYACGAVLAAMSAEAATREGTELRGRFPLVGAPATFGAALGFAATGISLPQVFTPASLFLFCLVLLSAGGLVYGSVLDARIHHFVRASVPTHWGRVRVEERHLPIHSQGIRLLREGIGLRRWMTLDAETPSPWEVEMVERILPVMVDEVRILVVGGGASPLARIILRQHAGVRVTVLERNPHVLRLAAEYMETGLDPTESGATRVETGNMEDLLTRMGGIFDVVVVDTAGLGAAGGVVGMSARAWAAVRDRVAPGGVLLVGPEADTEDVSRIAEEWTWCRVRRTIPLPPGRLSAGLRNTEQILVGSRQPLPPRVTDALACVQLTAAPA